MSLTGFIIQTDLDQLPVYPGTLTSAKWAVYNSADGKMYQISADQIAVSGNTESVTISATAGSITNIPSLHGRKILTVQRGGQGIPEIIYTGTPDSSQCLWNSTTDDLMAPAGNNWLGSEKLTILFV